MEKDGIVVFLKLIETRASSADLIEQTVLCQQQRIRDGKDCLSEPSHPTGEKAKLLLPQSGCLARPATLSFRRFGDRWILQTAFRECCARYFPAKP